MKPLFTPKPEPFWATYADLLLQPLMYVLQGNVRESPQGTHVWNNVKLPSIAVDLTWCVHAEAIPGAAPRRCYGLPISYMPIIGGWSEFVVLEPEKPYGTWYAGWIAADVIGYSQVPLDTAVRLLVGDGPVTFFGVDEEGCQIPLKRKATGTIGKAGYFGDLPLL